MGGLGQELSGVNENFRKLVERCLSSIAERLSNCLDEARQAGLIARASDVRAMADLLVNCWEGAALRSRLRREPSSLNAMLDFYLASVTVPPTNRKRRTPS
jgi:TetR/AcrR family transcriptional repressor of nem operon